MKKHFQYQVQEEDIVSFREKGFVKLKGILKKE